ncbi:hypothetical protein A8V01_08930 [Novosphingobium guangzhouense]|uniref:Uncharacterized protein n=2 Tax=Novosphingobium guangzhouense TaxID=1850347 RepID=A0A2K2FUP6_9SPHN|nr:hypothetical protein A8V01_08930 [Novosphingobium guangzhouense]
MIYSPARGGMVPAADLRASIGDPVELDRFDTWFARSPYSCFALTVLLMIVLPSAICFGLIHLFT